LKLMKVLRNVQRVGNRKRKEGMQWIWSTDISTTF
jgi:hypothetical protein